MVEQAGYTGGFVKFSKQSLKNGDARGKVVVDVWVWTGRCEWR
jgi:hypothetical protein